MRYFSQQQLWVFLFFCFFLSIFLFIVYLVFLFHLPRIPFLQRLLKFLDLVDCCHVLTVQKVANAPWSLELAGIEQISLLCVHHLGRKIPPPSMT
jgi:hypothetical protein